MSNTLELLDEAALAAVLKCSRRHVRRLRDAGKLPLPLYLGRCVRWRRFDIEDWLALGAPDADRLSSERARRVKTVSQ